MEENMKKIKSLKSTWYHVTKADSTERDEGVVDTIEIIPFSRTVILQSREDGGRNEHQERSEEEDEDDGLHQDHHNLGTALCGLSSAWALRLP